MGGFEYYDENGELVTLMDGTIPLTTTEILKLFPYYAVIMRDSLFQLLFCDKEWTITVTDSEINYNGDNIGQAMSDITNTGTEVTLDDMMNAEVWKVSHSYRGGAAGLGYSDGDSIAIYGNIEIIDNTTNKIFS